MTLGENLKMNREMKGMSIQDLAFKTRLGTATIEKFENDEWVPELDHILKISTVLDIPASELLEKDNQVNPCGMDSEIESLVNEIGIKKAKLILRKAKEFSEEDILKVMQMLYEIKYE